MKKWYIEQEIVLHCKLDSVCVSLRAGCDTKSIFKASKAYLNLEFPLSYTGCQTKAKETLSVQLLNP